MFDLVPGPFVVNGTNAANAINYSVGFKNLADFMSVTPTTTWGQVTVDGFEPMEFINKTTLVINGLAGSDTINLNNPNNPTGLTAIGVSGGDPTGLPTGTDTVIVSGEIPNPAAGPLNTVFISYGIGPTAIPGFGSTAPTTDEATVTNAQLVPVEIDQAESLVFDDQSLGNNLIVEAGVAVPAAPAYPALNVITLTPGTDRDSGTILANRVDGASELPIQYLHLGGAPVAPIQVASEPPAAQPNETANKIRLFADTVVYNGTTANDTFEVASVPDQGVTLVSTPNSGASAAARRSPT